MKALNVAAAFTDGDGPIIDRLKLFADAYVAERDLLQQCCDRKMSRVITLLDHGQVEDESGRHQLGRKEPGILPGALGSTQKVMRLFFLATVKEESSGRSKHEPALVQGRAPV